MDSIKKLEYDLWQATERQDNLQKNLRELITENENFRHINTELKSTGQSSLELKDMTDKYNYERRKREKMEQELELFKTEFDNQLTQQLEIAIAETKNELEEQILRWLVVFFKAEKLEVVSVS